tara:strand:- start:775 stop:993 length:219 start_codon:yes stop_codon:yes gene_type:complete
LTEIKLLSKFEKTLGVNMKSLYTGLTALQIKHLEANAEQRRQARENRHAKKMRQRLNRAKAKRQEAINEGNR